MDIIVIGGPTASGKTKLAAQLAHEYGLEIVSADSRQVYRGLNIGTGKDLHEYKFASGIVPYHLIDIADPRDTYTLYHYQRDCYQVLRKLRQACKPVIIAGGSGLYIEAVLRNYAIANVPENSQLRMELMKQETLSLLEALQLASPDLLARTDTSSKKRIIRSLEVYEYGRQNKVIMSQPGDLKFRIHVFALNLGREIIYQRIDKRLYERLKEGMENEVEGLLNNGVPYERLIRLGMEYKEISMYLKGYKEYDRMVGDLGQSIKKMSRAQLTYFRGMARRGLKVTWLDKPDMDILHKKLESVLSDVKKA